MHRIIDLLLFFIFRFSF